MKQQVYRAALYMRLSRDDEDYGESVSIETQRKIVTQFANDQNFIIVDEYVDDGWTGTNFERPAFKRMIEDIESEKINCIVTKDLSRLGREHIMMDYYLEFYFPEKRIRYIAVTENEDTEKGLSDFVPFKNLFNEWFAKDTSRKVKAAFKAKFAAGDRICTYVKIGYKRDPEIKNRIVPDEETRWIPEKIFDMAYHGCGAYKITKTLIEEKVITPSWINYQRFGTFAHIYQDAPEEKRYMWTVTQVKSLLTDETYIGNTIHYKQTNISYKNKKRIHNHKDEWWRIDGTHEPLISKDVFDSVQKQIASRRRMQKNQTTQIFAGLVKCADCGWSMRYGTNKHNRKPYNYFTCSQYGQSGKVCSPHYIRYDVLYAYVLSRIQYWIAQAKQDEDELLQRLLQTGNGKKDAERKKFADDLKRAEKRQRELDNLFAKLYEDRIADKITERNFIMLSAKYQEEQSSLEGKINLLNGKISENSEQIGNAESWVQLIRQYTSPTELDANLLNTLVEKILIHAPIKHEDGNREQEVEIFYKFVGKID